MKRKIPVRINCEVEMRGSSSKETSRNQVTGALLFKKETVYILYNESIQGIGEVQNTIKITNGEVTVIRRGPISMHQSFQEGKTTEGSYSTPGGVLHMETSTNQIHFKWTGEPEKSGFFELAYNLKLQGQDVGLITLHLTMQEVIQ